MNRGHPKRVPSLFYKEIPIRLDGDFFMAEQEGFEPAEKNVKTVVGQWFFIRR